MLMVSFGGKVLDAREDLIPSLKEVLGEPPAQSANFKIKPRETFFSVVKSDENSELRQLIQNQQHGIEMSEEEQGLLTDYLMGGNVSGSNSVMRRIYPPVLNWLESNIQVSSGISHSFIYCTPNANGPFPTVLLLDPEIAQQFEAGQEEYNRVVRSMPVGAGLPWEEPYRGRYITHSPLGNQLMSHAVSVIIPISKSLETADDISIEDWKSVLDFYTNRLELDTKSLFLVATKEFAGLAIRLASSYPFIGLMLEEPEEGIFETRFPQDHVDAVQMIALQETYEASLKDLECPTLIIRHKQNPALNMNDALILKPLLSLKRPLFMSMTDYPFRSLGIQENGDSEASKNKDPDPRFSYDAESVKRITLRMLNFIETEGEAPLYLLPETSSDAKSIDQTVRNMDLRARMAERFNKRLNPDDHKTQTTNVAPVLSNPDNKKSKLPD